MKVTIYGFSLESGSKKIPLNDLYDDLKKRSGQPDNSLATERRIYVDDNAYSKYLVGLVVTVRDQKRFLELSQSGSQLVITVNNLKGKNKLMEFNFFVIRKSNGLGLYQHYFQSCALGVFGHYLRRYYSQIRKSYLTAILDGLVKAKKDSPAAIKKARKDAGSALGFSQLVHAENLQTLLNEFQKIKSFEYEFAALESIKEVAQPLSQYVRRRREKVVFGDNYGVGTLAKAIYQTIKDVPLRSGRVSVLNVDDEIESIRISDVPQNFGEQDYDSLAAGMNNLNVTNFSSHKTIKDLIAVCESDGYKHIFEAQVKP